MKRAAAVLAVVMALFAGYIAAVSALLSVDKARTRAISQLSAWSGRTVTAGENAELELFPSPSLILSDLHVSGPGGDRENEVVVAERVTADIRLLPLLIGRIRLGALTLDNADIRLLRDSEGRRNWQFDSAPAAVQLALSGDLPFDRFVLNNATITYDNRKRDESETAEVASLTLDWEDIRQPAVLRGTVTTRGETVAFRARLGNAPAFFDGKTTAFSAELTGDMLNARFDGEVADHKAVRFSGELDASGPSLRRIIGFFGGPRTTGPGLGPIAISGHTEFKPDRFFVDRGSVQLDDNSATGTLSVSIPDKGGKPKLTGTLAFSAMDITPYLQALGGADNVAWRERRIDTDWFDNFDADVRISAESIVAGRYTFGSTAASAFMTNRLLEFGLAQAMFYGGVLSGTISVTDLEGIAGQVADIQLRASEFNLGETVGAATGSPDLGGTATMSLDLETRGDTLGAQADSLTGSLTVVSTEGGIPDFGLGAASDALAAGTPLHGVSRGGASFYQRLKIGGRIGGRRVILDDLLLAASDYSASLKGTISLADHRIDLTGSIGSGGEDGRRGQLQISGPVAGPTVTLTLP